MSLSIVGSSDANFQANKFVGQSASISFLPTSTWEVGDYVFAFIGVFAATAGTSSQPILPGGISLTAGWSTDFGNQYFQQGFSRHPYWFPVGKFVDTAGFHLESCTVTFNDFDGIDGFGVYLVAQGIGVRGGGGGISYAYVPLDNSDTDNVADGFGGSPQTVSFPSAPGWPSGTGGSLLFYVASAGGSGTTTADSYAWSGATEIGEQFQQNWVESGVNDVDTGWSSAYTLLGPGVTTLPADSVTATYSAGGTVFHRAMRTLITFAPTPPTPIEKTFSISPGDLR